MESSNLDQVELASSLNISSDHLKAILNYKVNLDKVVAAKLAQYFSMRVEAFDREYELS